MNEELKNNPTAEELVKEETKKNKEDKKKIALICISIFVGILFLSSIIFVIYSNFIKKDDPELKETNVAKKKSIYLYKDQNGFYAIKKYSEAYKEAFEISVTDKNAKIYDFATNIHYDEYRNEEAILQYILYEDNGLKLLDVLNNKTTEIDLDYDEYLLHLSYDLKTVKGIVYNNEEKVEGDEYPRHTNYGYYNLSTKKKMYDNKYDQLTPEEGMYIIGSIEPKESTSEDNYDEYKTLILRTDKEELVHEISGICEWYSQIVENNGKYFVVESSGCTGLSNYTLYDNNFKEIYSGDESGFAIHNDGTATVVNGNTIEKYNIDGQKISTSKTYQKVLHVFENQNVYVQNNEIYVEDNKVTTKLGTWDNKYYYHYAISGYYKEDDISSEENKAPGLYLIFEYNGSNEGPGFEYYYNPETKEVKKYELEMVGGYAKPVLYLYPEETTEVTINFEHEDNLTTTYPKFKDEWKVTAHPNGDLYDAFGKYYYGLYWEESSNHKIDFTEGFYVSKDNAISFLEEKLSIIGLNDKERNEFIMYWLPILEKNEHSLVYFELTEERDSFNKLKISPKPDSLLRMAIHVKKVNGSQNIKEQKLTTFTRTGFTVVEWGGIAYN